MTTQTAALRAAQAGSMRSMFEPQFVTPALWESVKRLSPQAQWRNPVMFVCYVGAILTAGLFIQSFFGKAEAPRSYIFAVSVWLWFTVLFANFAEAIAEGRSRAQAASLRAARREVMAKKLRAPKRDAEWQNVPGTTLRAGDFYLVQTGEVIPADGEIVEGVASVDESAITGESAPVIRESGGDRSAVTGGTRVLSDWIKV
ncbi:MAG TPA: potassium-transporting ATPase subunit B, partial [Burkholderiales bacterium]|nr:potassium-transporting ATPase subunit B [Burkholderiales bacterium]